MEIIKLGDLCEIISGKKPNNNLNSYLSEKKWGLPFPKQSDINQNMLNSTKLFFNSNYYYLTTIEEGNDIYFLPDAEAKPFKSKIKFCMSPSIWKLCTNEEKLLKNYLYYWIIKNKKQIDLLKHGTTIQHISKTDFKNISIKIPKLSFQQQIIDIIEPFEFFFNNIIDKKDKLIKFITKLYDYSKTNKYINFIENIELKNKNYSQQKYYVDTSLIANCYFNGFEIIQKRKSRANLTCLLESFIISKLKGENKLFYIYDNYFLKFVYSTGFINFIVKNYLLHTFGFLTHNDFIKQKYKYSTGSVMSGLTLDGLKKIKFNIPSIEIFNENIQRKIILLLTKYEICIIKLKKIIKNIIEILVIN